MDEAKTKHVKPGTSEEEEDKHLLVNSLLVTSSAGWASKGDVEICT